MSRVLNHREQSVEYQKRALKLYGCMPSLLQTHASLRIGRNVVCAIRDELGDKLSAFEGSEPDFL